jgi:hypothetical protein
MAPGAGLEPATSKLTASCSTIELPGIISVILSFSGVSVNMGCGLFLLVVFAQEDEAAYDNAG